MTAPEDDPLKVNCIINNDCHKSDCKPQKGGRHLDSQWQTGRERRGKGEMRKGDTNNTNNHVGSHFNRVCFSLRLAKKSFRKMVMIMWIGKWIEVVMRTMVRESFVIMTGGF